MLYTSQGSSDVSLVEPTNDTVCSHIHLLHNIHNNHKQYPDQVLSSFLGAPTAATTIGDVLTEISCTPTLLCSLKYGHFFSSRPLV